MKWPQEIAADIGRRRFALGITLAIVLLLFPCGTIQYGDGGARLAQAKSLLQGSIAIPPPLIISRMGVPDPAIIRAPNGQYYSKYGLGLSLVWLPPTAVAYMVHRLTGMNFDVLAHFLISFVNPVITLVIGLLLWSLWRRAGASIRARSLAMVTFLAGTSMLAAANTGNSEPLCALILLAGVTATCRVDQPDRAAVVAGLCIGALATIKPELVLLPPMLLPSIWQLGIRRVATYAIAASWGLVWILASNWLQRGHAFQMSYGEESSRFGSPLTGLVGYFLGVDRNILLFNAGLLVASVAWSLRSAREPWGHTGWVVALLWIFFLLFYSSWWEWRGGWSFGPRFFIPLIPITFLPLAGFFDSLPGLLRGRVAQATVWFAAMLLLGISLPVQMAGISVKHAQAVYIANEIGESELMTQIKLFRLKLLRGPRHAEIYHKSDFVSVLPPEQDLIINQSRRLPFAYLNHWWAIYTALKLRGVSTNSQDLNAPSSSRGADEAVQRVDAPVGP